MTDFAVTDTQQEDCVLALVAAVEQQSEHPIAQAIVQAAEQRKLQIPSISEFQSITGMGVQATVDGQQIQIGADRFMTSSNITLISLPSKHSSWVSKVNHPLCAINGRLAVMLAVSDPIKSVVKQPLSTCMRRSKVAMILGYQHTADAIAKQLALIMWWPQVMRQVKWML